MPTPVLQHAGNIEAIGSQFIGDSIALTGVASIGGALNVTGLSSLASVNIGGMAAIGGNLGVTGSTTLAALTASTATVASGFTVTGGDVSLSGAVTVTASTGMLRANYGLTVALAGIAVLAGTSTFQALMAAGLISAASGISITSGGLSVVGNTAIQALLAAADGLYDIGTSITNRFRHAFFTGTVTAATVVAALTGNASTATALQTPRNINNVAFNGTADITVAAAAGTLTGTALPGSVVTSSLTSVGTLGSLAVSGTAALGALTVTNTSTFNAASTFIADGGVVALRPFTTGGASYALFRNAAASPIGFIGYGVGTAAASDIYVENDLAGSVIFSTNGVARQKIDANGHNIPIADASYDLASASFRFRHGFFSGTVTATTFSGALSGNATTSTSATSATTAGSATTAATVTTAAQPTITSLGTLVSLTVSGTSTLQAITGTTGVFSDAVTVNGTSGNGGVVHKLIGRTSTNDAYVGFYANNGTTQNALIGAGLSTLYIIAGGVTALSFSTSTQVATFGASVLPGSDSAFDLGSATFRFRSVYFSTAITSSTLTLTGQGQTLTMNQATTGAIYAGLINSGNTTYLGIESSAGGAVLSGASAYSTVINVSSARSFHIGTNGVLRLTIDSAGLTSLFGSLQLGTSRIRQGTAGVSVSTSGVGIWGNTQAGGAFLVVSGSDGTNVFMDIVSTQGVTGGFAVISSTTTGGAPSARTYTYGFGTLTLQMASGTYTVKVHSVELF